MLLYLLFAPAVFGLIPGHLRWMHALPLEGLTGRLVVDTLVQYLNFPGAAIVIVSMVVIALYLSTTFSFSTAQQWTAIRFAFALPGATVYATGAPPGRDAGRKRRLEIRRDDRKPAQLNSPEATQRAAENKRRVEDAAAMPTSRRGAFAEHARPRHPGAENADLSGTRCRAPVSLTGSGSREA